MAVAQSGELGKTTTAAIVWDLLNVARNVGDDAAKREFVDRNGAMDAASRLMRRAQAIARRGDLHLDDARVAVRYFGRCRGIAVAYGIDNEAINAQCGIAQIIRCMVVPNRDEARLTASGILEEQASQYRRLDMRPASGVELTNASLCILEMHNPTEAQLRHAEEMLMAGQRLKTAPLDWAYSEFNIGMCRRLIADLMNSDPSAYESAWNSLLRAERVFGRCGGLPDGLSLPQNLAHTLVGWRAAIERQRQREQVASAIAAIPDYLRDDVQNDPIPMLGGIRSNPKAYGFDEVPKWATRPSLRNDLVAERGKVDSILTAAIDANAGARVSHLLKWGEVLDRIRI